MYLYRYLCYDFCIFCTLFETGLHHLLRRLLRLCTQHSMRAASQTTTTRDPSKGDLANSAAVVAAAAPVSASWPPPAVSGAVAAAVLPWLPRLLIILVGAGRCGCAVKPASVASSGVLTCGPGEYGPLDACTYAPPGRPPEQLFVLSSERCALARCWWPWGGRVGVAANDDARPARGDGPGGVTKARTPTETHDSTSDKRPTTGITYLCARD